MSNYSVSTAQTLTVVQNTPLAEIYPTSGKVETDDVGSSEGERRKEEEAHQSW